MLFKINFEELFRRDKNTLVKSMPVRLNYVWEQAILNTGEKASFCTLNYQNLLRTSLGLRRFFLRTISPLYFGFTVEEVAISLAMEIYSNASLESVFEPKTVVQISSIFTKEWFMLLNTDRICREYLIARHDKDITVNILNSFESCSPEIFSIISDRYEVFRKYFASYSQENGLISIDVYFPSLRHGGVERGSTRVTEPVKLLSEWDIEIGFFRKGFEYQLAESNRWLREGLVSLDDYREIADFNSCGTHNEKKFQSIWRN